MVRLDCKIIMVEPDSDAELDICREESHIRDPAPHRLGEGDPGD